MGARKRVFAEVDRFGRRHWTSKLTLGELKKLYRDAVDDLAAAQQTAREAAKDAKGFRETVQEVHAAYAHRLKKSGLGARPKARLRLG